MTDPGICCDSKLIKAQRGRLGQALNLKTRLLRQHRRKVRLSRWKEGYLLHSLMHRLLGRRPRCLKGLS
jgi:hypothetical protein